MKYIKIFFRLILLFSLVFFYNSCMFPPFDRDISLAMETIENLHSEAKLGPFEEYSYSDFFEGTYFLPCKDQFNKGFLIIPGENKLDIYYLEDDRQAEHDKDGGDEMINIDNRTFNFLAVPLTGVYGGSINSNLLVFKMYDQYLGTGLNMYNLSNTVDFNNPYSTPDGSWRLQDHINSSIADPTVSYSASIILGISLFSYPFNTDSDRMFCLGKFDSSGLFYEVRGLNYDDNITGSLPISYGNINDNIERGISQKEISLPFIPDGVESGFYHYNPNSQVSYFSFYDNQFKTFRTFRWYANADGQIKYEELDIPHGIDAVLSTGELFCELEDEAIVYSPSGNFKYDIPMGDLKFAYEFFYPWNVQNGKYIMIFTFIYWEPREHDGDRPIIRVYSLPTSKLGDLD
jgi:hypothetical protein